ncbi:MAG TPA: DUF1592 domain-containing protein [Opitutaceae bacterium]|nr:DUF1592 domain-containing protein [Opitutaceae bacterium]
MARQVDDLAYNSSDVRVPMPPYCSPFRRLLFLLFIPATFLPATRADLTAPSHQGEAAGLIRQYCWNCHGDRGTRGGINFTTRISADGLALDAAFWRRVLHSLEDRSMPEDADRRNFTEVERQHLVLGIRQSLRNPDEAKLAPDPGPVQLRRLTQYEYASTLRDLLGVEAKSESLPADDGGRSLDPDVANMGLSPFVLNSYLNVAQDALDRAPRARVVLAEPSGKLTGREAARKVLEKLLPLAYRQPVEPTDLEHSLKLFDLVDGVGRPYEESLKITLSGVLASPRFLLHIERPRTGDGPQRVEDYNLASRLSYFIWSSMPDDELLRLAAQGKLADDKVVAQQVRRMLRDPKAKALAENFGLQWLGLRRLRQPVKFQQPSAVDTAQPLRAAMQDEAALFLDSVFRGNGSLLTLFDANYTFANEDLARNYGLPNVRGAQFRRVPVPPERSGGVLTLGGVQVVTAIGARTSPVVRGRWVTEVLLGDPTSPGFYETCRVSKDDNAPQGAKLRARLDDNRSDAKCAICHDRFDPPGLALENFDALGRWRTEAAGQPIDATARLANGATLAGPAGLKQVLLATGKDALVRNLTERMFAFALGRDLEPTDRPVIRQICDALAKDNYRASTLIAEITRSLPFTYRRPEKPEGVVLAP